MKAALKGASRKREDGRPMEAVRSGIFTRLTVANNELHLDSSSHRDNIFHAVERCDVWAKDQRKIKRV